jgi:hypothetical protein
MLRKIQSTFGGAMDIAEWLHGLGLGQYAPSFNEYTGEVVVRFSPAGFEKF